jgi:hypothetical protein
MPTSPVSARIQKNRVSLTWLRPEEFIRKAEFIRPRSGILEEVTKAPQVNYRDLATKTIEL